MEHWYIKNTVHVLLKWRHNLNLFLENFAHLEHASCLRELAHESLGNVHNSIYSNGVEAVFLDQFFDPVEQVLAHERIFLSQVRQSTQPTVLQLPWIVPVIDFAGCMVVFLFIERNNIVILVVIFNLVPFHVARMVDDDINHNKNTFGVSSFNQSH